MYVVIWVMQLCTLEGSRVSYKGSKGSLRAPMSAQVLHLLQWSGQSDAL